MDEALTTEWAVDVATDTYDSQFSALDMRFFGASIAGSTVIIVVTICLVILVLGGIGACLTYWLLCVNEDDSETEYNVPEEIELVEKETVPFPDFDDVYLYAITALILLALFAIVICLIRERILRRRIALMKRQRLLQEHEMEPLRKAVEAAAAATRLQPLLNDPDDTGYVKISRRLVASDPVDQYESFSLRPVFDERPKRQGLKVKDRNESSLSGNTNQTHSLPEKISISRKQSSHRRFSSKTD